MAISFAALAGSALLLGTYSTVQATGEAEDQTIALGMTQQLMDEIMGNPYIPAGGNPYAVPIGPLASQANVRAGLSFRPSATSTATVPSRPAIPGAIRWAATTAKAARGQAASRPPPHVLPTGGKRSTSTTSRKPIS